MCPGPRGGGSTFGTHTPLSTFPIGPPPPPGPPVRLHVLGSHPRVVRRPREPEWSTGLGLVRSSRDSRSLDFALTLEAGPLDPFGRSGGGKPRRQVGFRADPAWGTE